MNSCILMAEIVQEPQLRYTTDQMALAEMLVQFPGLRAEDQPATLKVVGWGNLAQEIQQKYHQGDRIIIEGRLSMNTVPHPEGFKEKRAELTAQKIHLLGVGVSNGSSAKVSAATGNGNSSLGSMGSPTTEQVATRNANSELRSGAPLNPATAYATSVDDVTDFAPDVPVTQSPKPQAQTYPTPQTEQDVDDIPFVRPVSHRTSEELYDSWEVEANRPGVWLHGNRELYL